MTVDRADHPSEYVWNIESIYKTKEDWETNFQNLLAKEKLGFTDILSYKGQIKENALLLKNLLDNYFAHSQALEKVYTFAQLRHHEDITEEAHKNAYQRSVALWHEFGNASSWIESEILQIDENLLKELIGSSELKDYRFYLTKLLHQKKHVLSSDKEEILAQAEATQRTPSSAFSSLCNADMKFPEVTDSKGNKHVLSQGTYQVLIKDNDRTLRENAFKGMMGTFANYKNTITELLQGNIKNHVFRHRVRNYASSLEASLSPNQIPVNVYHNLIQTTKENIDALHEYIALRKEILGVDELHAWDLYAPLVKDCEMKFPYEEACNITINSVSALGKNYQLALSKGIREDRWVDVYENKGKRSGAYSSGCYDSMPFILMNYHGHLNDVLTLAHEAGHSMNTLLSNQKQAYHEASYSLFVAEVASTFNEQLTYEYLLANAKTKEERLFILSQQIDAMRATFFRQVMFAEFELKMHELAENNMPLTPLMLEEIYGNLNKEYFGPAFTYDDLLATEFLRIPHFYYNFYVYQYATGIAAAVALVEKVKKEGSEKYLEFLSSGGSDYPIEVLKVAGVNMLEKEPIESFIEVFRTLVKKLKNELKKNSNLE